MQTFNFMALPLAQDTLLALTRLGITEPTPIQQTAWDPIHKGQDTVVQATVGTGKTLAYLLPLLAQLHQNSKARFLILAPTPELAVQILRVVEACKPPGISSVGLIGGTNAERQRDKLKKHPTFMVGTPGRVLDFIASKKIKLPSLTAVVLDESDEILASEVHDDLAAVLGDAALTAQKICVSATFGAGVRYLVDNILKADCATARGGDALLSTSIHHISVRCDANRKDVALLQLLHKYRIKQALVFVNKRAYVPHLYRFLNEHDIACEGLSAERDKRSREAAMVAFRNGRARVLVATDAAARGIDVRDLPWVLHYEPARDVDTYVHRAGRTGRAGKSGTSLTLVDDKEMHLLRRYSKELNISFDRPD